MANQPRTKGRPERSQPTDEQLAKLGTSAAVSPVIIPRTDPKGPPAPKYLYQARFPWDWKEPITAAAKHHGLSVNEFLLLAVREKLEKGA